MNHKKELQLLESHEKTNHEKIMDAYRIISEKLDILIKYNKKDKKAKTGT